MLGAQVGIDVQRVNDIGLTLALGAGGSPGLLGQFPLGHLTPLDGFHHLTDHAVSNHHNGVAVLISHVKGHLHIVSSFLNGSGSVNQVTIVAVAAAAGSLEIVTLCRLNGAQTGAATHHVDDNSRQLCATHIGDAFLLQGNSGRGRGGHDTHTAAGSAVDHVDGCHFGLGLQEAAADLRQMVGQVLRNLVLGGDGITEEILTAGTNGGFGNRFVAFPQFFFHWFLLSCALR